MKSFRENEGIFFAHSFELENKLEIAKTKKRIMVSMKYVL